MVSASGVYPVWARFGVQCLRVAFGFRLGCPGFRGSGLGLGFSV